VLGSASPGLLPAVLESLAAGWPSNSADSLTEIGPRRADRLWCAEGFPGPSWPLPRRPASSGADFIRTFIERDILQLGIFSPAQTPAQVLVDARSLPRAGVERLEFARAFGVSAMRRSGVLDTLSATFVVRQLQPWHENIGKRQARSA
jgi:predicted AAA+ superfamily ATPase